MSIFLQLQLFFSLGVFFIQLALEHVKTVRVLLFSSVLVAFMICLVGIAVLSAPQPQDLFPLRSVSLTETNSKPVSYSLELYNTQLTNYLEIASVQPTHRDILLNLSLLYRAQDNQSKAQEFWLAAKQLDPNNPVFKISPDTNQ